MVAKDPMPRRLGRGLDSLISSLAPPEVDAQTLEPEPVAGTPDSSGDNAVQGHIVPISSLKPNPAQPRTEFDESKINKLAESIRANGIIQPITVRPARNGFEIVAGERRWRAAQQAGLETVPISVRNVSNDQMLELALIENIHREDLNAIERARAYRQFCDEIGLNASGVASRLGEDRTTVTNYLRLLELPAEIQTLVVDGGLTMGHARSLAGLEDASLQLHHAQRVIDRGLSVRALEKDIRKHRVRKPVKVDKVVPERTLPAHLRDIEKRFEEVLGTKTRITLGIKKSTGQIAIQFFSVSDFERICHQVGVIDPEAERGDRRGKS